MVLVYHSDILVVDPTFSKGRKMKISQLVADGQVSRARVRRLSSPKWVLTDLATVVKKYGHIVVEPYAGDHFACTTSKVQILLAVAN